MVIGVHGRMSAVGSELRSDAALSRALSAARGSRHWVAAAA